MKIIKVIALVIMFLLIIAIVTLFIVKEMNKNNNDYITIKTEINNVLNYLYPGFAIIGTFVGICFIKDGLTGKTKSNPKEH